MGANILRFTLSSTETYCVQGGYDGVGRIIIRTTQDIRMALFEGYLSSQYFTIPANTILVLDPPNLLANDDLWFQLNDTSGSSTVIEVLRC